MVHQRTQLAQHIHFLHARYEHHPLALYLLKKPSLADLTPIRFAYQHTPSCIEETRERGYQNGIDVLGSLPPPHHHHAFLSYMPPHYSSIWVHGSWLERGLFPLGFFT